MVRAQRIYSNYSWPNPITVKLENIEPALDPPLVETIGSVVDEKGVTISGRGTNIKDSEILKGTFEYHIYSGFSDNINNTEWIKTGALNLDTKGIFRINLNNLEKGKEYEYRAIIEHPKITIRGEIKRFTY